MKNQDMKVSLLLKEKLKIESDIDDLSKVIGSINGEYHDNSTFKDGGTVGVYSNSSEFRFSASKEVMLKAASDMLEIQLSKLEPITKKLEAIELMLNS